jgi:hypothetical protein
MLTEINSMTPKEIRIAGLNALIQNLGIVGMVRFLQDIDNGYGDYTLERHTWLGNPDVDDIASEIESMRK